MRPLAGVAAAACLLWASTALAWKRSTVPPDGPCLWWRSRDIPFVINEKGSEVAGATPAIQAAKVSFAAWNEPTCSDFNFVDQGTTSRTDVGYDPKRTDNIDLVVWRETSCSQAVAAGDACLTDGTCANRYGCWDQSPDTIAVTTTTFSNKSGEIYDADIEFNGAGFVFTTVDQPGCTKVPPRTPTPTCVATDVRNTLTHEIGHIVGLDHSDVVNSTMYFSAPLGEISKRTLEQDDLNGLCTIYPAGAATVTCVPVDDPVTGNGCGCSASDGTLVLAGFLTLLPLLRKRA